MCGRCRPDRRARRLEEGRALYACVPAQVDRSQAPDARPRAPVSIYTGSRELGHGSEELMRLVYADMGTVWHRSEVVEVRIEQHREALKDRLANVGFVTRKVTRDRSRGGETKTPAAPKHRRGKKFRSGPGATRTRDLLLRRQALYPTELRTRKDLRPADLQQCRKIVPIRPSGHPILTAYPPDGSPRRLPVLRQADPPLPRTNALGGTPEPPPDAGPFPVSRTPAGPSPRTRGRVPGQRCTHSVAVPDRASGVSRRSTSGGTFGFGCSGQSTSAGRTRAGAACPFEDRSGVPGSPPARQPG